MGNPQDEFSPLSNPNTPAFTIEDAVQAFTDLQSGEQPGQYCISEKDGKKGAILVSRQTAAILAAGSNSMVDASRDYPLSQPYFSVKGMDPIDPLVQGEFDPSLSEDAERDRYEAISRAGEVLYQASTLAPPVTVHLLELAIRNKEGIIKDKGVRSEEAKLASALVRVAEDALRQTLRVTSLSQHHRELYAPSQNYRESYVRGGRGRGRGGRYNVQSHTSQGHTQNTVPGNRGTGN